MTKTFSSLNIFQIIRIACAMKSGEPMEFVGGAMDLLQAQPDQFLDIGLWNWCYCFDV